MFLSYNSLWHNLLLIGGCRSAAAALMLGDEFHNKYGRCRPERNDFSAMGLGAGSAVNNPGSRQIYLTFPADSTFKEEDVSNYFRYVTLVGHGCFFCEILFFFLFLKKILFRFVLFCFC